MYCTSSKMPTCDEELLVEKFQPNVLPNATVTDMANSGNQSHIHQVTAHLLNDSAILLLKTL